jgi:hypothetical protein
LFLKLVDETKFELHLQGLRNIFINKAEIQRYKVGTLSTIRIAVDAPMVASDHESERLDSLSIRCSGFGMQVAVNHEQVVPTGRGDIDGMSHNLTIANDRYAGERHCR